MNENAKKIMTLKQMSGRGIAECKKSLESSNWDVKKALEDLSVDIDISKFTGKLMSQGTFGYFENEDTLAVIELLCQTDFVANNGEFIKTANIISHQYALNPHIMNDSFKESIVNYSAIDGKLKMFKEAIIIGRTYYANKKEKNVYTAMHSSGANKIFATVELNQTNQVFGKQIALHVLYFNPLSISKNANKEDTNRSDETTLIKQKFLYDENVSVEEHIRKHYSGLEIVDFYRIKIGE